MSVPAGERAATGEPSRRDQATGGRPADQPRHGRRRRVPRRRGARGVAGSGSGESLQPGPGTWPAIVSVTLVVLGIVLAVRGRRTADAERFTRTAFLVLAAVGGMVLFVAVIGVIGFEIPTTLLALFWLRFLGRERWRTSIVLSLAITIVFYLLFVAKS